MERARSLCAAALVALAPWPVAVADEVPASSPALAGDPSAGRARFSGARRLENGGAPCGACHALAGEGPGFAASLGPDLTHSFEGLPAEALDGLLQDLPFPTMAPIYGRHALTAQERAHLASFLGEARSAPPTGDGGAARWAGFLAAACIGAMALAARRRGGTARARLGGSR